MSSSSSDAEREFPRALPAVVERGATKRGKAAKQGTVDGNTAPEGRKRKRVRLTPEDRYRIATLDKRPLGKQMSHRDVARWCNTPGNLVVAKKPDNTTISKIRSKADAVIRKCVSSPQVGASCIGTGSRRRVLTMG